MQSTKSMPETFNTESIARLKHLLLTSQHIVVTVHMSPDGDALGSSLGLKNLLSVINPDAQVTVVTPDGPTKTLSFLPGYDTLVPYTRDESRAESLIAGADLLVSLDYNALSRIDLVGPFVGKASSPKVLIDHHLHPEDFADITFSFPEKSATCQLLFEIIQACGFYGDLTPDAANCLLAGMMTDTGDFSYNISDPGIYNDIALLIKAGADKAMLTRRLFNTFSESCLRIQGFALSQRMDVFHNAHAAIITLSREDLNEYNYKKGDTEGLVNKPLSIPGILYSCYLREEENYIKVSMRSLADFPVNELCSDYFSGGGHRNAAGGEYHGTLQQARETFISLLETNKAKYIDTSKECQDIINQ